MPQHRSNMDSQPLSRAVRKEDALLGSFISAAHAVLLTVLDSLCEPYQDDTHHLLMDSHSLEESSTSTLALFRYLKRPDKEAQGHNKHTELGTLTLLLTKQRGLQVLVTRTRRVVQRRATFGMCYNQRWRLAAISLGAQVHVGGSSSSPGGRECDTRQILDCIFPPAKRQDQARGQ
jgi:hypothetical protein